MEELFKKYNLFFDGKKRKYVYPLPEKLFDMEYTTPLSITIGNDVLKVSSWGELITELIKYLLSFYPKNVDDLLKYKTKWSNAYIFSNEKKINHVEIRPDLFVNLNHTALHSCWLVVDLLTFFNIDFSLCKLVIHRMPKAEPEEVRNFIRKNAKEDFRKYLVRYKLFSDEKIAKIIKNIDYLNNVFAKRHSGYDDLYLFDDALLFSTSKSKFIPEFAKTTNDYEKNSVLAKKYLDYLSDFYRDSGYYSKKS